MSKAGEDPATLLARAGVGCDPAYHGIAPPLWSSDTNEWRSPTQKPDYDYSRTVNPNRDLLLDALASLEGAVGGAITSSGQSAALLALLLLKDGSLVVAPHDCYGGTYRLLQGLAERGTLTVRFIDQNDEHAVSEALGCKPALVWIESPSNPLLRLVDVERLCTQAHLAGALVIADNTLATPCRQQPIALGCDLVMHSTTKALNGHHDLFGGALLAKDPELAERISWWANAAGLSASAFDCWQVLRGLRTLTLRVERQEASALGIARWLADRNDVLDVHYPGLSSHPQSELAARQQQGPGFILSFRVKGGEVAVRKFVGALELITLASSLGGFSTLICTPSSMTHRGMPPEAQEAADIFPDLLRLSVGLEEGQDLIADLGHAFAALSD
ncbi:MAG TPA: PLP-dependent transferase [Sphingomicrobium sp.]|nr:PLP-dependent transferase [Sphingomicrobium sp.]